MKKERRTHLPTNLVLSSIIAGRAGGVRLKYRQGERHVALGERGKPPDEEKRRAFEPPGRHLPGRKKTKAGRPTFRRLNGPADKLVKILQDHMAHWLRKSLQGTKMAG